MLGEYSIFPECKTCKLKIIGACTISADCKSCSNPAVNQNISATPATNVITIVIDGTYERCQHCGNFILKVKEHV